MPGNKRRAVWLLLERGRPVELTASVSTRRADGGALEVVRNNGAGWTGTVTHWCYEGEPKGWQEIDSFPAKAGARSAGK